MSFGLEYKRVDAVHYFIGLEPYLVAFESVCLLVVGTRYGVVPLHT